MSLVSFLEIMDRVHEGPACAIGEWDKRVIPNTVREVLKEHGLMKTFTPENPVNTDDSLADAYWKAGFDFALKTGMLCIDTERVIKFTEDELRQILRDSPSKAVGGYGEDRWEMRHRRPEDPYPPVAMMGALGIDVDEEIYVPALCSIAQHREIDILDPSILSTIHGRKVKAKTPYETLVAMYEAKLHREIVRRVGRPHMTLKGIESTTTEYGDLAGYGVPGGLGPDDFGTILSVTELKTTYTLLHKVANDIINVGGRASGNHYSIIGGYIGPAEGCAVGCVASAILQRACHFLTVIGGLPLDFRDMASTRRDSIWASSVSKQAIDRNTHMLHFGLVTETHGPCTKGLLYEIAVGVMNDSVSGCCYEQGTRPCGCRYPNYFSGLENKFAAEVLKAAAGMKRDHMNEIAKKLIPKYEDKLERPPKGKSIYENTDLKVFPPQPIKEWYDMYLEVKKELEDLGVDFGKIKSRTI